MEFNLHLMSAVCVSSQITTAQKTIMQELISQKEVLLYVICLIILIYKLLLFCVYMMFPTEVLEGKTAMLLGMSQWNSNDLVEQIETLGQIDQTQGKSKGTVYPVLLSLKQLPKASL